MIRDSETYVIVRCDRSAVHCGVLQWYRDRTVCLTGARKIWRWKGGNTLNEIANHGPKPGSKISERVAEVLLLDGCEILECSAVARDMLDRDGQW